MSIPRAATSVATNTRILPALKPASAWVRCDWLRLPWMRSADTRFLTRNAASRLARCFVRVKASTLRTPGAFTSSTRSRDLSSAGTA
jgi:hypothetical protein